MDEQQLSEFEERIRNWPSLEDTERQLTTAMDQIAQAITARVPTLQFQPTLQRVQQSCSSVDANGNRIDGHNRIGAVSIKAQARFGNGPIPDDVWPDVLADARRIAATYGMTELEKRADRPGFHDVRLYDFTGNEILLGHEIATGIFGNTGCRLKGGTVTTPPTSK